MVITQIDTTPIGDCFHDSGVLKLTQKLEEIVDEFEIETNDVYNYCDSLISALKNVKTITKKAESEYSKVMAQKEIKDSLHTY